jgi:phage-related protein
VFEIKFYRDINDTSDVLEYIQKLRDGGETDKNKRINYEKIMTYINLLAEKGTKIGKPVVKYLDDGLYELRPLKNRIMFFYFNQNSEYIILSHFIKKTLKTPPREIQRALNRKDKYERKYKK